MDPCCKAIIVVKMLQVTLPHQHVRGTQHESHTKNNLDIMSGNVLYTWYICQCGNVLYTWYICQCGNVQKMRARGLENGCGKC